MYVGLLHFVPHGQTAIVTPWTPVGANYYICESKEFYSSRELIEVPEQWLGSDSLAQV